MASPEKSGASVAHGSTMILSQTNSISNPADMNFSDLLGSIPTPTTNIIKPTTDPSLTITTTTTNTNQLESPSTSMDNKDGEGLTTTQLGAIIGGSAGGLLVILSLICCIVIRKRNNKPKKFNRGRGITPSMVMENNNNNFFPSSNNNNNDKQSDQQSTYSFNAPQNAFGSENHHYYNQQQQQSYENNKHLYTPTSPSQNVTATLDQLYNIKQNNHQHHNNDYLELPSSSNNNNNQHHQLNSSKNNNNSSSSSSSNDNSNDNKQKDRETNHVSVNGARLSKYNYLTQAFSQMRASYANQETDQNNDNHSTTIQYPSPIYNNNISTYNSIPQQNILPSSSSSSNDTNYHSTEPSLSIYNQHHRNNQSSFIPTSSPSPVPSMSSMNAPSITVMNEKNEESILHQGHVLNNTNISTSNVVSTATVTKKLYFPGSTSSIGGYNRDSTVSDVSAYSTYSTSSNPFRYSDDQLSSSNEYHQYDPSPSPSPSSNHQLNLNNHVNQVARSSPLSEKPYTYI
ncbi:unnamed protein product [Cunninghamella blakesleeana]